jgi:hypothetical protein
VEADGQTSMGVGTAWKNVHDEVFNYTHTVEVQSDQTELNTMAVRPVLSKEKKRTILIYWEKQELEIGNKFLKIIHTIIKM